MTPVIKWAGGKRQLLTEIKEMMPEHFNTYYEPFLGGGAVFFDTGPGKAVINDSNPQLIGMYKELRDNAETVAGYLDGFQNKYNDMPDDRMKCDLYYNLRDEFNVRKRNSMGYDARTAALLIFLNKAGFNGLYRVNSKGQFNVPPAHRKILSLYDRKNLSEVSSLLKNADIKCRDFEPVLKEADTGDFVFIDSPYYDTFDRYQAGGFSENDHKRLAEIFKSLADKGVMCMETNSDTDFIKELYKGFRIRTVQVRRSINRNGTGRKGCEVIITSY